MTHLPRTVGRLAAGFLVAFLLVLGIASGASADPVTGDGTTSSSTTSSDPGTSSTTDSSGTDSTSQQTTSPQNTAPTGPKGPRGTGRSGDVNVNITGLGRKPSTSVSLFLTITLLSLAPAILLTCTSFTKILVVLSLTRNALGLQQTPPNQVLAGLALFLSLFIMSPVLSHVVDDGVKPYMDGTKTSAQAWHDGSAPLKTFMLHNTDDKELELLTNVAKRPMPKDRDQVGFDTLVPAFVLSELKDAFTIGFIIFIPFLVIDIVVSGALMALGMMMMPPVMVSLPFKLLLFVLVDGWALVIKSLIASYG